MLKRYMGYLIIMLVIMQAGFITKQQFMSASMVERTPLEEVFIITGAEGGAVTINGWVKVNADQIALNQPDEISKRVAGDIAMTNDKISCEAIDGADYRAFRAVTRTSNLSIDVTTKIMESGKDVYLVINVEKHDGVSDFKSIEGLIYDIMQKKGDQLVITTCLSGWVNGKLEEEKMKQLVKLAFHKVNGRIVEGVSGSQFVSYTGFTRAIERFVFIGRNRINLNIAMRHNNSEMRTYVTVATPVITKEY